MTEPWFDPVRFGSLFAEVVGGVVAVLLGFFLVVAGVVAGSGRGRGFVLGALTVFLALGALCILFGLAALILGQPFAIWFPPVLTGAILAVVFGALRPFMAGIYRRGGGEKGRGGDPA